MTRHRPLLSTMLPLAFATTLLVGCERGPPERFFVIGSTKLESSTEVTLKDAYVWRQPNDASTFVVATERKLPELPPEDIFPAIDLNLLLTWSGSPVIELALDEHGQLLGYEAMNGRGRGGESAPCNGNPGACRSAIEYWSGAANWGDTALTASYEFRHEIDITIAQPIHRQTQFQTPLGSRQRIDARGKPAQRSTGDFAAMFARYEKVRAALDENNTERFLAANGYAPSVINGLVKFDGLNAAVNRLAQVCPGIQTWESFASDGGFGSLLIHYGGVETAVYFTRRGDDWILNACGSQ